MNAKLVLPLRAAVLVSGGGTNLQALIDYKKLQQDACPYMLCLTLSDCKDAFALKRAKEAGIPTQIVSPYAALGAEKLKTAGRDEKRKAVSNMALKYCREYQVDVLVLAGFLTILTGAVLGEYANRIINLHPALLPKFGGLGMWGRAVHEAVIAAKETESGCTVHLVDGGCDTGRILLQKKVAVFPDDSAESLSGRIAPEEHRAIVEGLCLLALELAL